MKSSGSIFECEVFKMGSRPLPHTLLHVFPLCLSLIRLASPVPFTWLATILAFRNFGRLQLVFLFSLE